MPPTTKKPLPGRDLKGASHTLRMKTKFDKEARGPILPSTSNTVPIAIFPSPSSPTSPSTWRTPRHTSQPLHSAHPRAHAPTYLPTYLPPSGVQCDQDPAHDILAVSVRDIAISPYTARPRGGGEGVARGVCVCGGVSLSLFPLTLTSTHQSHTSSPPRLSFIWVHLPPLHYIPDHSCLLLAL